MSDANETCPKYVSRGGGYTVDRCGRPVKADGLCGIHLAAKQRRDDNERARTEKWERQSKENLRLHALAARLTEVGVPCSVTNGWVTLNDPGALAERLDA